jgi:O-acetyl-ADP-ribose deacetylase (regulator of RNase III)
MHRRILIEHKTENDVIVRVVQGDLTQEPVEAIVNAANSRLAHGGGVAGAIVHAGGWEIQRESDDWVAEHGPVPTGGAGITGAGRLPCQRVIHAVGPIWRNRGDEDQLLASAVTSALELAAEHGLKTVSLPGISTGIFGFPKERGARVIIRAVLAAVAKEDLEEVNLTNIDPQTAGIFARELKRLAEPES